MSTYKAGRPSKYNPTTKKGVEPDKCKGNIASETQKERLRISAKQTI